MSGWEDGGQFPDETRVLTPYPRSKAEEQGDRSAWPWLPGTVVQRCGPDEWLVVMDGRGDLAFPSPDRPGEWHYPLCNRDSSELREISNAEWEQQRVRRDESTKDDTEGEQG